MTGQGISRSSSTRSSSSRSRIPRPLHGQVYTDQAFAARGRLRFLSAPERGFYRLLGVDPERDQDWKGYAKAVLIFSVVFSVVLYACSSAPGASLPQPGQPQGRSVAHLAEHGGELRHEHELAVLRRRVHDVVPVADGRPRGAELRLGRGRDGGAGGGDPRVHAALDLRARELLAGPVPLARLHPAAALDRARRDPHLAGRRPDLRRARDRDDARGRAADDRARPGRVADRDQAARDERRRLLQLELRRPVREPERHHELPLGARDPPHPGGAGVHVREDGARAPAGLVGVRGDVRRCS